jgi:protein phosphatase PTC7
VDSGLFAQALCRGALETGTIQGAYEATKGIRGSSTLAIVNIDLKQSIAKVDTLGDSRVALIRKGKVIESTIEQEHSFGVPYQLTSEPNSKDLPTNAIHHEWTLQSGDILVAATDGIFDNLEEDEIATICTEAKTCRDAVKELVTSAWVMSQKTTGETPYSRAATEVFDLIFQGGKKDDVTCVVCKVE